MANDLLGPRATPSPPGQMTYDLRPLSRRAHFSASSDHRYVLTPYGWKVARLYARLDAGTSARHASNPDGIADPNPRLTSAPLPKSTPNWISLSPKPFHKKEMRLKKLSSFIQNLSQSDG